MRVSEQWVRRKARRAGVDPDIAVRWVGAESGFNARAKSPAGAMGLTQLMPGTAAALGVRDPWDPEQNLDGGLRYLKQQLRAFGGDYRLALAAYNAGPGNARKAVTGFPETRNYVARILGGASPRASMGAQARGARAGGGTGARVDQALALLSEPLPGMSVAASGGSTPLGRLEALRAFRRGQLDPAGFRQALEGAESPPAVAQDGGGGIPFTGPARGASGRGRGQGGALGGSLGQHANKIDAWGRELGAPVTARKEPGHAAGGDHDPAVHGATAFDFGGSEAVRSALFRRIAKALGQPKARYKGADLNVTVGGVRYQVISRDHGTGPHLHVGLRRA